MKSKFLNLTLITSVLSLFLIASNTASAQAFYKWVDSKGSTHYTTTPPPKNAKKTGKVDTYGSRQHSQPQTAQSSSHAQNSNNTIPETQHDVQQQEANAALEQGRNQP